MFTSIDNFFSLYDSLFKYILYGVIIIFICWIFSTVVTNIVFPAIDKKIDKKEKKTAGMIIYKGFSLPLTVFIRISGVLFGILAFSNWSHRVDLPLGWNGFFNKLPQVINSLLRIFAIISVGWGFVRSSDISSMFIKNAKNKLDLNVSKSVRRFLSAIYNVIVVGITAVAVLNEFNIDINGLIAGLGIGGLTLALAAKDSAENFFGGLIIVTEKPFEIGDWIECDSIVGAVEDINLRSSKVRTTDGSLTIVPNSLLSSAAITNWSGTMERRKARFNIDLCFSTTNEKIEEFCSAVTELLNKDPEVLDEGILVRFSEIGDFGPTITIVFNTSMPGYADHMRIKERINYGIIDISQKLNVEFAYPTHTVYMENSANALQNK